MSNAFNSPKSQTKSQMVRNQSRRRVGKESFFISAWIVGGIALVGCRHDDDTFSLIATGAETAQSGLRGALGGPIQGAKIYIDEMGTGIIDPDAPFYVTDKTGLVEVPEEYRDSAIIADFSGAVDIQSGAVLGASGTTGGSAPDLMFRSLRPVDPDGYLLATPLTDLLSRSDDPQGLLDAIFGMDVVTLADVNNPDFYTLSRPPVSEAGFLAFQDTIEYKFAQVSIALLELRHNPDINASLGDDPIKTAALLREIISGDGEVLTGGEDDAAVRAALDSISVTVGNRLDTVIEIARGKPVAIPDHDASAFQTNAGEELRFLDQFLVDGGVSDEKISTFFGFHDPAGNAGDISSHLNGVLFRVSVDGNGMTVIMAEDGDGAGEIVAMIGLADTESTDTSLTPLVLGGPSGLDEADDAEIGQTYAFVDIGSLPDLVIIPVSDFTGEIDVPFRVWDGEQISDVAIITINVTASDTAPPVTPSAPEKEGEITLSETVIDPDSSFVGVISITDADGDPVDPETIRIEGNDAGSFEIRINPDLAGFHLSLGDGERSGKQFCS